MSVLDKIKEAKEGGCTELDLTLNNLSSLPESIGDLGNLEWLSLRRNNLTTLPESIGDLGSLEYLNLECNPIISLPRTLSNLSNLEKFYCSPIKSPDNVTTFNGMRSRCFIRLKCGNFVAGCWRGNGKELVKQVRKIHKMDIQDWCPEVVKFL